MLAQSGIEDVLCTWAKMQQTYANQKDGDETENLREDVCVNIVWFVSRGDLGFQRVRRHIGGTFSLAASYISVALTDRVCAPL